MYTGTLCIFQNFIIQAYALLDIPFKRGPLDVQSSRRSLQVLCSACRAWDVYLECSPVALTSYSSMRLGFRV